MKSSLLEPLLISRDCWHAALAAHSAQFFSHRYTTALAGKWKARREQASACGRVALFGARRPDVIFESSVIVSAHYFLMCQEIEIKPQLTRRFALA